MKKFLLLGLVFLCPYLYSFSQQFPYDTSTVTGMIDYHLRFLNKSTISTGLLLNRVEDASGLHYSNSGLYPDTTTSDRLIQAYADLKNAQLPSSSKSFTRETDLIRATARFLIKSGKIPVSVLNCAYQVIDPEAVTKGLLYYDADSFLHDVPGRSASPYKLEKRVLAGIMDESPIYPGKNYKLIAPASLWFNNSSNPVVSISVLLPETNRSVQLSPNQPEGVDIAFSPGPRKRTLRFTLTMGDGSTLVVNSTIQVDETNWENPACYQEEVTATIPFLGINGVGTVSWWYRHTGAVPCTEGGSIQPIFKPIIFLDGFDPMDKRKASEIYNNYLKYKVGLNEERLLGEEIRNFPRSYDVAILNFIEHHIVQNPATGVTEYVDGGADYIQRNAFLLIKVIQETNARLSQTNSYDNQIVLVGPSMGGQISRYALAYMEKKFLETGQQIWKHNCRLWVSFDSPHNGASIPLGVQHFLEFFARKGNQSASHAMNKQILSPAARQMLVNHVEASSQANPAITGSPNFHLEYYNDLKANGKPGSGGWPKDCRKIALVNGSLNGTKVHTGPNCEDRYAMRSTIGWYFRFNFGPIKIKKFVGFLQAASAKIRYIGDNGNPCQVFYGSYMGDVEGKNASSPAYTQSIENSPGGVYNIIGEISSGEGYNYLFNTYWSAALLLAAQQIHPVFAFLLPTGVGTEGSTNDPNCSFIPTKSALGFFNSASDLSENLSNRNLVCTKEIPFDAYFGENINTDHVRLSEAKANWVLSELDGNFSSPSAIELPVSGPAVICLNNTANYSVSVPVPCENCQDYWSIDNAFEVLSGQGSQNLSVKALVGVGDYVVRFTSSNTGECKYTGTKSVHLGKPSISRGPLNPIQTPVGGVKTQIYCTPGCSLSQSLSTTLSCDVSSYLTSSNELVAQCGPGNTTTNCNFTVNVNASNTCGTAQTSINYMCKRRKGPGTMMVNPTVPIKGITTALALTLQNEEDGALLEGPFEGEILDVKDRTVLRFSSETNPIMVNIQDLEPADYRINLREAGNIDPIEANFVLRKDQVSSLSVSPNPAIKDIDNEVTVVVLNEETSDNEFEVTVDDFSGVRQQSFHVVGKKFPIDIRLLPLGTYLVTVQGENTFYQEDLQLTLKGKSYLSLSPNPAISLVSLEIVNPIKENNQYKIAIMDKLGNVVNTYSSSETNVQIDVSDLQPDLYYLMVSDGYQKLGKIFRKQ